MWHLQQESHPLRPSVTTVTIPSTQPSAVTPHTPPAHSCADRDGEESGDELSRHPRPRRQSSPGREQGAGAQGAPRGPRGAALATAAPTRAPPGRAGPNRAPSSPAPRGGLTALLTGRDAALTAVGAQEVASRLQVLEVAEGN